MLIALPISRCNPPAEKRLGFFRAVVLRQGLRVHLIAWNVIGVCFQQGFEMRFGGRNIAFAQAFERNAVARKRIVGILGKKLFQLLPPGFVLFGHGSLAYYTCRAIPGQRRRARESNEGKGKSDSCIDG